MEALTSHKSDAPREMRKTADLLFDRIYKFYFNRKTNVALTTEEENVRLRWDFAWKMLANMYTPRQVCDALCQRFEVKKSIAYNDVNNAMKLFGDPRQANKDAKRIIAEEWIVRGIKKAWDDQDLDAYERLVGKYNKINKLEEDYDDKMESMFKNFQPAQIIIVAKREDMEAEIKKLQKEITLDVAHEE